MNNKTLWKEWTADGFAEVWEAMEKSDEVLATKNYKEYMARKNKPPTNE